MKHVLNASITVFLTQMLATYSNVSALHKVPSKKHPKHPTHKGHTPQGSAFLLSDNYNSSAHFSLIREFQYLMSQESKGSQHKGHKTRRSVHQSYSKFGLSPGQAPPGMTQCYECGYPANGGQQCPDPFGGEASGAELRPCKGLCVKWLISNPNSPVRIIRTCTDRFKNIELRLTEVCMFESRPGNGHMCLCTKSECNATTHIKAVPALVVFGILLAIATCSRCF